MAVITGNPNPREINEQEVFDLILSYREYKLPNSNFKPIKDLPKLSDLAPYGVPGKREELLWASEVVRLVGLVRDPNTPLGFEGFGNSEDPRDLVWDYDDLTNLANRLIACLSITALDDNLVFADNVDSPTPQVDETIRRCAESLRHFLEDECHLDKAHRQGLQEGTCHLIDYVTGLLARLFAKSAEGGQWDEECLAALSTWSAKMKHLCGNIEDYANDCLQMYRREKEPPSPVTTDEDSDPDSSLFDKGTSANQSFSEFSWEAQQLVRNFIPGNVPPYVHDTLSSTGSSSLTRFSDIPTIQQRIRSIDRNGNMPSARRADPTAENRPLLSSHFDNPSGHIEWQQSEIDSVYELQLLLSGLGPSDEAEATYRAKTDLTAVDYWSRHVKYRTFIYRILLRIGSQLRGSLDISSSAAFSSTSYEISSALYITGFEKFQVLLYQNRCGALSGTSLRNCISIARFAFGILHTVARDKQASVQAQTDFEVRSSVHFDESTAPIDTYISWSESTLERGKKADVQLRDMRDIISMMVVIQLTDPYVVNMVNDLIELAVLKAGIGSATSDVGIIRRTEPRDTLQPTSFTMFTSKFVAARALSGFANRTTRAFPTVLQENSRSLSTVPFMLDELPDIESAQDLDKTNNQALDVAPAGYEFMQFIGSIRKTRNWNFQTWLRNYRTTANETRAQRLHEFEQFRAVKERKDLLLASITMYRWRFYEDGVMLDCKGYVIKVVIVAAILVLGGITIGLTVGDRIEAVDPFGIAAYLWAFAAFFVLIAKSLLVQEWSWRDFLRGQVFCRSITELAAVSKIDRQIILAKLLHDEKTFGLKTTGPYNSVFLNRSSNDAGLSINVPLSMKTLLRTGLIMVKVATPAGDALVCLDVRKSGSQKFVEIEQYHIRGTNDNKESFICCRAPMDAAYNESYTHMVNILRAERVQIAAIQAYEDADLADDAVELLLPAQWTSWTRRLLRLTPLSLAVRGFFACRRFFTMSRAERAQLHWVRRQLRQEFRDREHGFTTSEERSRNLVNHMRDTGLARETKYQLVRSKSIKWYRINGIFSNRNSVFI